MEDMESRQSESWKLKSNFGLQNGKYSSQCKMRTAPVDFLSFSFHFVLENFGALFHALFQEAIYLQVP